MTATIHPLPLPSTEPSPEETASDVAEIFLACGMPEQARLVMTAAGVGAILDAAQ